MEEYLTKPTLVSGLFYIGRDKWKQSGFGIGNDRYKWWLPNILSLNSNLILFTDNYYYDYIIELKERFSLQKGNHPNISDPSQIQIIKLSLDDLESFQKYYNRISCLMGSPDFKKTIHFKTAAEMNYPLYNIIMYNKVNLIKKALNIDTFNSTHFYWTDIGAFRNELSEYKNITWPTNKFLFTDKIVFFSHMGDQYNIHNQRQYFMSQIRVVQGGYFIVPKNQIDFLKVEVDNVIKEILDDGYIGSDEKIFDLICKRNPNQVNMIKSGWFDFYKISM